MSDVAIRALPRPGADDIGAVHALVEHATRADGCASLDDEMLRALERPSEESITFIATLGDTTVGALQVIPSGRASPPHHVLELVVDPEARRHGVGRALLRAALEHVRMRGGDHVVLWIHGADARADAFASAVDAHHQRDLWQMRVPLLLAEEPDWPEGITTRSFALGDDEEAWLVVNNRAFSQDPDQGGWDAQALARRMAEPWFDPGGFLLAHDDRGLAGFCWTKIHPPEPPAEPDTLGEICVIGVDPDRQGTGLGRALLVAGLGSLADRAVRVGMLYVDASNTPAVALYESVGFTVHRILRAYRRSVEPLN